TGDCRAQNFGRDPEDVGDGDGGQQVHDGMTAGHGAFKIHAESAEARAGDALLHVFGPDIGGFGETEGHGAAEVDLAEAGDAQIVGIEDGDAVGRQSFDQFPLGGGDALDGIEELHVGVADVGDYPDVGFGDGGELADFSGMVHADLDDAYVAGVGQAKQGERHADVVVEIAIGFANDGKGGLQQVRDGVFGGGFARAAGHGDDRATPLLARPGGQVLEVLFGIGDEELDWILHHWWGGPPDPRGTPSSRIVRRNDIGIFQVRGADGGVGCGPGGPPYHYRRGAFFGGGGQKIVPIVVGAA